MTDPAALVAAVRILIVAFPSASDDADLAGELLDAYTTAVEGIELQDVRAGVTLLLQAKVAGAGIRFRPSPAALAEAARQARVARQRAENAREPDDHRPISNSDTHVAIHKASPEFCALERYRGESITYVPSASGYYTVTRAEFDAAMAAWSRVPVDERHRLMAAKRPPRPPDAEARKRLSLWGKQMAEKLSAFSPAKQEQTPAEKAAALKKHDAFWGLPNRDDTAAAERRRRLDESLAAKQEPKREREPGEDDDEDDEREPQWWQK